jgi:hypothetical protein
MAERILMNEYKALAKEDWVNIEVRLLYYMDMFRLWGQALEITNLGEYLIYCRLYPCR